MPRSAAGPVLLLVLVLVTASGCRDGATLPMDPADLAFSRATHDVIPAPVLAPTLTDNDVLLTYSWQDDVAWDFVTFSVWADGVRVSDGLNLRQYAANYLFTASWTQYDAVSGDHEYCVKVMAKSRPAKKTPSSTNHSSACVTVTVP